MNFWSIRRFSSFLTLSIILCGVVNAAPIPVVRILVERDPHEVKIEGYDLLLSTADTGRVLAREDRNASITVQCSLGGKIKVRMTGVRAKQFDATGPLKVESLGGFIRVQNNQYREELYLYSFNGDCAVINHVDMEKYIAGLLDSEMSANWNKEALKAQAVAARTYAFYQLKENGFKSLKPPFDLESDVRDQVYEGAHKEKYKSLKAVQETKGQILTVHGQPIKAFYHSTCGGHTEEALNVWRTTVSKAKMWASKIINKKALSGVKKEEIPFPGIQAVSCGYCQISPRYTWNFEVPLDVLQSKLQQAGLVASRIVAIKVSRSTENGRASDVEVRTVTGSVWMRATKLRELLGNTNIKSTWFSIHEKWLGYGRQILFAGRGLGHGVGMCQWGAKAMADQGQAYTAILQRYYPKAAIKSLY